MKKKKNGLWLILFCLIISLFFLYPYWINGGVNLEHDTLFHLSRIEGLAHSLQEKNWLPRIYPYKNGGYGYGSPLFYSDLFLLLPALLMLWGIKVAVAYKLLLLLFTFLSALTMALCLKKLTSFVFAPYLGAFLYLFCNYRITDVYVRGALGEVMALAFLPLIPWSVYCLIQKENKTATALMTIAFSGLILTHNISFLLGCLMMGALLLINFRLLWEKDSRNALFKAILLVFGLTAFFTLPMLEQLLDHTMIVHLYGSSSALAETALCAWQFFINQTIFGLAGNSGDPMTIMVTNPGWFLTFAPLTDLLIPYRKKTAEPRFIRQCLILGGLFLASCSAILPWEHMAFCSILQFPWRLMTCAVVLLCIPAAISPFVLFQKPVWVFSVSLSFSLINAIWLLQPVLDRTFLLSDRSDYHVLLDGSLIDPYYSATWMRVELAGGDYLPWPSVDYRGYDRCIRNQDQSIVTCEYSQASTTLFFALPQRENNEPLLAPLTWYKGYQAYQQNEAGQWIELSTTLNLETGLVQFVPLNSEAASFKISYKGTLIQKISEAISLLTLALLAGCSLFKKRTAFVQQA